MKPLWLTGYSATHHPLFQKHFKPSFDTFFAPRFELQARKIEGNPGKFGEKSFNQYGTSLMVWILEKLKENPGRFIIYSGCDFRFYEDFYAQIERELFCKDLVGIYDVYGPLCGDFAAFIVTPKILGFYEWMIENDSRHRNQQFTYNAAIAQLGIAAHQLSADFYTVGMTNGGVVWKPGDTVNPPKTIKLHHGNFTIGADNKLALLDAVMEKAYAPIL